jgi:heme-degrading monooxygenase HmoA
MAVMMIMEAPEGTIEQYEQTNEIMGLLGDEDAPEGLIQHVAATDGNGLLIVDVWESEDAFGRFYEEKLGPALEQTGVAASAGEPTPPIQVHNRLTGKGGEPNVLMLIDVEGLTSDQYDQMASRMPAHADGGSDGPWVAHTAAKKDGGIVVADLWESAEAFGQFAQEQIAPAGQEAGMGPIEPRLVPVHNVIRGKARVS